MTSDIMFAIIQIIIYVVLGGLALYFKTNTTLKSFVTDYIAEAEEVYKDVTQAGGQKHEYVVTKLYELIPPYMKPFFPKEWISATVQNAFDSIEAYTKQGLDKAVESALSKVEKIEKSK